MKILEDLRPEIAAKMAADSRRAFEESFGKFLVNARADRLPRDKRYLFGELMSQCLTLKMHGIPDLGVGRAAEWRGAMWNGPGPEHLTVRSVDREKSIMLRCCVFGDFPTRELTVEFAVVNFDVRLAPIERIRATLNERTWQIT